MVGIPPYFDKDKIKLFENIKKGSFKLPNYFSDEAKDLIKKLLIRNPLKRLGAVKDAE